MRLADLNPDLIGCYRALRDDAAAVVRALSRLEREHRSDGDACYYDVRDRRFNPRRAAQASGLAKEREALAESYGPALAAMLIFLNRTGFNGLFRLNRHGAFNVPAGRYAEPTICDAGHLRAVAAAFRAPGVEINLAAFDETLGDTGRGDFVYCDPPVRAAQPDRELRQLHRRRLQPDRSGAAVRRRDRGQPPRRPRRGVQFQRTADPEPLFQPAGPRRRPARAASAGAPVDQLAGLRPRTGERGAGHQRAGTRGPAAAGDAPGPAPSFAQARFRSTLTVAVHTRKWRNWQTRQT